MSIVPKTEKDNDADAGLEPELLKFLYSVREYVSREVGSNPTVFSLRAASSAARLNWSRAAPAPPAVVTRDLQIGETAMAARLYTVSPSSDEPLLIYLHGGGWMMLGLDTHDRLMRAYAFESGCNILSLDYPLAPEVQFPSSLNASAVAVEYVLANSDQFANSSGKVVLGGDSSGANLVVSIFAQLNEKAQKSVVGLLLNYGVFDSDLDRNSYKKFASLPYLLIRERMEFFWNTYCEENAQRADSRAAPLRFERDVLALLPAVHMCIAAQDILVDENLLFEQKLLEARVDVSSHLYENAAHGFLEAVNCSPLADKAVAHTANWLKSLKD
ncbi:hypothetical protein MNBD_ALPHA11-628 [hydrothermal vent metagenome]|uniref:Alpha/beta hydrolase fold-3 domain-containing protein n=1 Tax=hydrothermal vent metagenome TaxID=652676 RepID=A0A3B0TNQ8_9ZZZZ